MSLWFNDRSYSIDPAYGTISIDTSKCTVTFTTMAGYWEMSGTAACEWQVGDTTIGQAQAFSLNHLSWSIYPSSAASIEYSNGATLNDIIYTLYIPCKNSSYQFTITAVTDLGTAGWTTLSETWTVIQTDTGGGSTSATRYIKFSLGSGYDTLTSSSIPSTLTFTSASSTLSTATNHNLVYNRPVSSTKWFYGWGNSAECIRFSGSEFNIDTKTCTLNSTPITTSDTWTTIYNKSNSYTTGDTFTLAVVWGDAPTVTLKFEAHGGTGTMADKTYSADDTITVPQCTFTRTGYKFVCWSDDWGDDTDDIWGDTYEVGDTITPWHIEITLAANWEKEEEVETNLIGNIFLSRLAKIPTSIYIGNKSVKQVYIGNKLVWPLYSAPTVYTVTFNANGGSGSMSAQSGNVGTNITLNANTFTRQNYLFTGWNTNADGSGTSCVDGQSIMLSSDITLYAVWLYKYYTNYLYYDVKGGSGAPSTQSIGVTYPNTSCTFTISNDTPYYYGYSFMGWGIDSTTTSPSYYRGSSITVGSNNVASNQSTTLYAIWGVSKGSGSGSGGSSSTQAYIVYYHGAYSNDSLYYGSVYNSTNHSTSVYLSFCHASVNVCYGPVTLPSHKTISVSSNAYASVGIYVSSEDLAEALGRSNNYWEISTDITLDYWKKGGYSYSIH